MIFGRSGVIHPMLFGKRVIVTFPVQADVHGETKRIMFVEEWRDLFWQV
jgi:hypothetical protein